MCYDAIEVSIVGVGHRVAEAVAESGKGNSDALRQVTESIDRLTVAVAELNANLNSKAKGTDSK